VFVPSGAELSFSRSMRGMHSVRLPVPSVCSPTSVSEITPDGAIGSGQSLFWLDVTLPNVMATPFALASSPVAGAPCGPQVSSPQPATEALIIERNRERRMSDDRIPEAIVLYHVFEDSLEPCAGPRSAER